jgi:ribosomal protein S10
MFSLKKRNTETINPIDFKQIDAKITKIGKGNESNYYKDADVDQFKINWLTQVMNLSQAAAAVAWKAEQEAKKSGDIYKEQEENEKRIKAFERYHWANKKKVKIEKVIKNAAREEQIDRLAAYDTYENDTPKKRSIWSFMSKAPAVPSMNGDIAQPLPLPAAAEVAPVPTSFNSETEQWKQMQIDELNSRNLGLSNAEEQMIENTLYGYADMRMRWNKRGR